jgi:hypothetical protein
MTELGLDGHGTILGVTALTVSPAEDAHISACDAEKTWRDGKRRRGEWREE